MTSMSARVLRAVFRVKLRRDGMTPDEAVRHFRRELNGAGLPRVMARGTVWSYEELAGVRVGRVGSGASSGSGQGRVMLYLHGGGYVAGKVETYANLVSRWAAQLGAEVWLPDYRLAPEHPYPAGLDDAQACYFALLERGVDPSRLVVAGDSAGGGLALALLLRLRDGGHPLPACAVVMSPAGDITCSGEAMEGNDGRDPMLSASQVRLLRGLYAPDADPEDPYVSPVVGDYTGLPPLYLTVDEEECLYDSARVVAERAAEAGVDVTLRTRTAAVHVWPVFVPWLAEAREDVPVMGAWMAARLG